MNKKLRNAVDKALKKLNEADHAIQAIEKHLTFAHFNGGEVRAYAYSGKEIVLEYQGREMTIEEAIERMEEYGYITPSDFV